MGRREAYINRDGSFRGGIFNLPKTMVSVHHKELEYELEKLKYKKLEVMQPRFINLYFMAFVSHSINIY